MENRRAIVISSIAFIVSLLFITGYLQVKRSIMTSDFGEEVWVVIATEDIPEYAMIREGMLEVVPIFKKYREPQTVESPTDIIGKATYVPIYKGEQVTLTKLVSQEGKPVLERQLLRDWRALTLPIAQRNGVAKLIRPGNRVDVLTTVNYDDPSTAENIFETSTVLQNILVLATGKNIQNDVPSRVNRDLLDLVETSFEERKRKDFSGRSEQLVTSRPTDDYASITLQLTPEDAEKLIFLSTKFGDGRIYFTLRNGADTSTDPVVTALLDDVMGPDSDYGRSRQKPPPPPEPAAPKFLDNVGGEDIPVN